MNENGVTFNQALPRHDHGPAPVPLTGPTCDPRLAIDFTDSGVEFVHDPAQEAVGESYEKDTQQEYILDPNSRRTYLKGKLLGKGGFARVHEVTNLTTNTVHAAKIIPKNRLTKRSHMHKIAREILIHKSLTHEHVVGLLHFFEDATNAYMILENCARKSLVTVLKHRKMVTEPEARYYLKQLVNGVAYIHSRGIIHRDLKPGNMLLTENMVLKIGDFGLATQANDDTRVTICGTPNYIAPEVLNKRSYSFEADVWAIGCILYTMLCGAPPFETETLKETYARIVENRYVMPRTLGYLASALVRSLLDPLPEQRPKLREIVNAPFFRTGYTPVVLTAQACHTQPMFPSSISMAYFHPGSLDQVIKKPAADPAAPPGEDIGILDDPPGIANKQVVAPVARMSVCKRLFGNINSGTGEVRVDMSLLRQQAPAVPLPRAMGQGPAASSASGHTSFLVQHGNELPAVMNYHSSVRNRLMSLLCGEVCGLLQSPTKATLVHKELLIALRAMPAPSDTRVTPACRYFPLYISKWIDYSNKYGFGFLLSDNSVGVHYNDNTRMSFTPDHRHVEYHDRRGKVSAHPVHSVPYPLQDRFILLHQFTRYMDENLTEGADMRIWNAPKSKMPVPYMQRWTRNSSAICMELSNGTLQFNFFKDHTKVIIHRISTDYVVTYVDKDRKCTSYTMRSLAAHGCRQCIFERLHFASSILYELARIDIESG